jgi:hypothetical protein
MVSACHALMPTSLSIHPVSVKESEVFVLKLSNSSLIPSSKSNQLLLQCLANDLFNDPFYEAGEDPYNDQQTNYSGKVSRIMAEKQ